MTKTIPTTIAHSKDKAYRWSRIKAPMIIIVRFIGKNEHNKETISTSAPLSILDMYPRSEFIKSNAIMDNKNLRTALI